MSAALQLVEPTPQYDNQQLQLLKRTIAADLNDLEFGLLVEVSRRTGLDLFMRQLYGIKRGGKMTLQTGIDGYRLLASRTSQLAGIDDAIFDTEEEAHPNRATVTVWRLVGGEARAFTATARWKEYCQPNGGMWQKMPYLMLAKCAEALALRKAFPAELSGVYTHEEMQQADEAPIVDETRPANIATVDEASEPMATEKQYASLDKLCDALGKPRFEQELTYAQAREALSQLSGEFQRGRLTRSDVAAVTAEERPVLKMGDIRRLAGQQLSLRTQDTFEEWVCGVLGVSEINLGKVTEEQRRTLQDDLESSAKEAQR